MREAAAKIKWRVTTLDVASSAADRAGDGRARRCKARQEVNTAAQDDRLPGVSPRGRERPGHNRAVARVVDRPLIVVESARPRLFSATTERSRGPSVRVLDDGTFEQVADVLPAIGGGLEEVEHYFQADREDSFSWRTARR